MPSRQKSRCECECVCVSESISGESREAKGEEERKYLHCVYVRECFRLECICVIFGYTGIPRFPNVLIKPFPFHARRILIR